MAELPRLCPCQQEKDPAEGLPSGSVEGSLDATKVPCSRASSGGAMQGKSSAAGARGLRVGEGIVPLKHARAYAGVNPQQLDAAGWALRNPKGSF